jgi:hypothetical protein
MILAMNMQPKMSMFCDAQAAIKPKKQQKKFILVSKKFLVFAGWMHSTRASATSLL